MFDGYRRGWRQAGRGNDVPINRLAYAAFAYCSKDEAKAREGAEKLLWHIGINKVPQHFSNPPGFNTIEASARGVRRGLGRFPKAPALDDAIAAGIMFAGTPDQVFNQFCKFYEAVGGFGHLLVAGQSGFLSHEDTVDGIRTLAREVYPRLRERYPNTAISDQFREAVPA